MTLDELGVAGEPVEDGATFETNAAIKARFGVAATGLPTLADDSGSRSTPWTARRASGRGGMPGEHATDADNNAKLLLALAGLPPERRGARYVCVLALAMPGGRSARRPPLTFARGTCRGRIATGPRGTGGFGYDPIFEPDEEPPGGRTFGQWTAGREERDLAPRSRRPADGAALRRARVLSVDAARRDLRLLRCEPRQRAGLRSLAARAVGERTGRARASASSTAAGGSG